MTHYAADKLDELGLQHPPKDGPAILLYDIETAPSLVYTWTQWDANVIATKEDWYMLCFAYKWSGQKKTDFVAVTHAPKYKSGDTNDQWVAHRLSSLFDRADVTVAHNGDNFDRKKANARFLYHDIDPPSPYRTVDTLKETRKHFKHYSNALNELGRFHQVGSKTPHTGVKLWLDCMDGDPAAWKTMEKYNRQDVTLLEDVFELIKPWIDPIGLNHNFWSEQPVCRKCGGSDLMRRGFHRTRVSEFQTWQCKTCKSYTQGNARTNNYGGIR